MKSQPLLCLWISIVLLAGPGFTHALQAETEEPDREVVYKETEQGTLKLYLFEPDRAPDAAPGPAIVFFFGGGWNSGSPSQFYPHCRHLASRGVLAIAADYRVKKRHGTSPFECVTDGKSAVRFIRAHAEEWDIDPGKIAAGGGSAGGHVAAATGNVAGLEEPGEDLSISSRPNALVLFNPVFDNGPQGFGHERVKTRWKEISPLHNIHSSTPPTIVFLGTNDKLVPVATAREYEKRMAEAEVRCDLHLYEDQPHGFFNFRDGQNRFYQQTVDTMDAFLADLGYF